MKKKEKFVEIGKCIPECDCEGDGTASLEAAALRHTSRLSPQYPKYCGGARADVVQWHELHLPLIAGGVDSRRTTSHAAPEGAMRT